MTEVANSYLKNVVKQGDEGSRLLKSMLVESAQYCGYLDFVGDVPVYRFPEDKEVLVVSAGGAPTDTDLKLHADSMVCQLLNQLEKYDAEPVAFTNVIDSSTGDIEMLKLVKEVFLERCHQHQIMVANGENAILGDRITQTANIMGTMIGLIDKSKKIRSIEAGTFNHEGLPVFINSDGVGTKTEIYERELNILNVLGGDFTPLAKSVDDVIEMQWLDALKVGGRVAFTSIVAETKKIPVSGINVLRQQLEMRSRAIGAQGRVVYDNVGKRLQSWHPNYPAFNLSGSVVSLVDEQFILNPPRAKPGQTLMAIRGPKATPLSNGISSKRRGAVKIGQSLGVGDAWHTHPDTKPFLDYLATPCSHRYPIFHQLLQQGLATSIYHLSGGAYNGKLTQPLLAHNLSADIRNLFEPDWRELALVGITGTSVKDAYAQWPMGTEGFFTTSDPETAQQFVSQAGFEARPVATLRVGDDGTALSAGEARVTIETYTGEIISYEEE